MVEPGPGRGGGMGPGAREQPLLTVDRPALQRHRLALHTLSNESSNLLLDEIWKEHAAIVDDCSSDGVDNFSGPIHLLVPNKHMVRNAKNWKSNLRSIADTIDLKKATETSCCKNMPSCCSKRINVQEELNILFKNKHSIDPNLFVSDDYQNNDKIEQVDLLTTENNNKNLASVSSVSKKYEATKVFQPKYTNALNTAKNCEKPMSSNNIANSPPQLKTVFKTAREQLVASNPAVKRSLGTARKTPGNRFISPMMTENMEEVETPEVTDERLKHIDPKMVELIQSEIIDNGSPIGWDDIAGLKMAKSVIQEAVVWPLLRPDIFTGLRRPPKGVLLFGPPGTGKTLIGKCVASQCRATFFNISASSLTSKWIGDGEKMVRALFAVAKCHQPAVIFIDEIDSLLTQRSDSEHEATRRIKTEFLVQFDGAGTGDDERLLIIGATNRPQELDEAARRRLVKRLYIPLPDYDARKQIVNNLMKNERNELKDSDIDEICSMTDGYSGADMRSLCSEAAMGPIRSVPLSQIVNIQSDKVRAVSVEDFKNGLQRVRPSVSQDDLTHYIKWNTTYGLGC